MKKLFLLLFAVMPAIAMQNLATNVEYSFLDAIIAGNISEFQKILPHIPIESLPTFGGKSALQLVLDSPLKPHINQMAMILLEKGAKVNAQDSGGGTAIKTAAIRANPAMVAELLRRGANPNLEDYQFGNALLSTIGTMCVASKQFYPYSEFIKVIRLLLQAGADPNTRGFKNKTALRILKESYVFNDRVHDLDAQQKVEVRELLLQHGARE